MSKKRKLRDTKKGKKKKWRRFNARPVQRIENKKPLTIFEMLKWL